MLVHLAVSLMLFLLRVVKLFPVGLQKRPHDGAAPPGPHRRAKSPAGILGSPAVWATPWSAHGVPAAQISAATTSSSSASEPRRSAAGTVRYRYISVSFMVLPKRSVSRKLFLHEGLPQVVVDLQVGPGQRRAHAHSVAVAVRAARSPARAVRPGDHHLRIRSRVHPRLLQKGPGGRSPLLEADSSRMSNSAAPGSRTYCAWRSPPGPGRNRQDSGP